MAHWSQAVSATSGSPLNDTENTMDINIKPLETHSPIIMDIKGRKYEIHVYRMPDDYDIERVDGTLDIVPIDIFRIAGSRLRALRAKG